MIYVNRRPSMIVGRYGIGFAYRTVLKSESTWRDIRGVWINTACGQLWLMVGNG